MNLSKWLAGPMVACVCASPGLAEEFKDTEVIALPAGSFTRGCTENAQTLGDLCDWDTYPARTIHLSAFEIDKYPVTFRRYNECYKENVCGELYAQGGCNWKQPDSDNLPVNCISWKQAKEYCEWEGRRLPTEAEWEKTARGTDNRIYPWGEEEPSCKRAIMNQKTDETTMGPGCGAGTTQAVDSRPEGQSPDGVMDMVGNVWEWVSDWYGKFYYSTSTDTDPKGPIIGQKRSIRGGDWLAKKSYELNAIVRSNYDPLSSGYVVGFRCAKSR
ncbi:MAG: formylglycine-generating enzyme family protein [Endozoicomonas sp.]